MFIGDQKSFVFISENWRFLVSRPFGKHFLLLSNLRQVKQIWAMFLANIFGPTLHFTCCYYDKHLQRAMQNLVKHLLEPHPKKSICLSGKGFFQSILCILLIFSTRAFLSLILKNNKS